MNLIIDLNEDGSYTVITKEGTFAEGIPITADIGAKLAAAAGVVAEAGEPEQHIHHDADLHVHHQQHEEAGHAN